MRSHSTLTPNRQPFLYLTAALVTGIVADRRIEPLWFSTTAFVVALSALSICFFFTKRDVWATIALLLAFVATGALLSLKERTATDTIPRLRTIYESRIISP